MTPHGHGKKTVKDARKQRADERNAARSKRSAKEQLATLDSRPGSCTRERARLEKEIQA
jgi:hypothetical protein